MVIIHLCEATGAVVIYLCAQSFNLNERPQSQLDSSAITTGHLCSNPAARKHVSEVHFCKTTDLCCNFLFV